MIKMPKKPLSLVYTTSYISINILGWILIINNINNNINNINILSWILSNLKLVC